MKEAFRVAAGGGCQQTVLFALMVRARDLGKPVPDEHAKEAFTYAEEVFLKVLDKAGPIERYAKPRLWMTAVADEMFRWVQKHLDRGESRSW